jgi:hypothetical protein
MRIRGSSLGITPRVLPWREILKVNKEIKR